MYLFGILDNSSPKTSEHASTSEENELSDVTCNPKFKSETVRSSKEDICFGQSYIPQELKVRK